MQPEIILVLILSSKLSDSCALHGRGCGFGSAPWGYNTGAANPLLHFALSTPLLDFILLNSHQV